MVPGYTWLSRQLDGVETETGGYERKMTSSVIPGAGLAMKAVLILAWLVALPVLLVIWLFRRRAA